MKQAVVLLCIHSFLVSPASSQNADISGTVSDQQTGERVPFATVRLLKTSWGMAANAQGFYYLAGIPPGDYEIAASSIGYRTLTKRIQASGVGKLRIDFALDEEAVEGPEVTVTKRRLKELREIQTSIQVLDQSEMKAVPATVQEDVFRSIQVLPGIVSTSDVSSQFFVRGGSGDQNLILLDGMRIYNPYHAYGLFSIVDPDILRATEIYTGAFPAGYGGKLSSVVNLVTKDGQSTSFRGAASGNFLSARASLEGPIRKNIRGFVSARRSISSSVWSSFLHDETAPLMFYDVFGKATLEGNDGATRLSLSTFLSGDDLAFSSAGEPNQRWRNSSLGATASGILGDRLYVTGVASTSSFQSRRIPKESGEYPTTSAVSDFNARASATVFGEHGQTYYFGFEFNFPTFSYDLRNSYGSEVNLHNTIADASMWFRYSKSSLRWSIDGGLHIDLTSLFRSSSAYVLQPRFHARLALFDDWALKGSFGLVTQHTVTVNNEADLLSLFDAWIAIPKELEAERAMHLVAGIGGSAWSILGLDAQLYYKKFGSLVVYNRDKVTAQDPDYISGQGTATGVEVMARLTSRDIDVLSSYTLGWVTISNGGVSYPPRYDRRHSLKMLAVYHASASFDLSTRWEFGSGLPTSPSVASYFRPSYGDLIRNPWEFHPGDPYIALGAKNSIRLPAFHRLDVAASYHVELGPIRMTMGASIINVYDRRNVFYVDRETGATAYTLRFFPSASVSIEYK